MQLFRALSSFLILLVAGITQAATVVPNEIIQPGTQPTEVGTLETPDKCDNCHGGGYEIENPGDEMVAEPAHFWRGSMMSHAGRDPIFWATVAIAEQDFDGSGDLCIRCHSTTGWLEGRSTPTDGSGLLASDDQGVDCEFCHKLTNPDNSEHLGTQLSPFIANAGDDPGPGFEGFYGSGIASIWGGAEKLGPYDDTNAKHQYMGSKFHRHVDYCGTCHDVSNPAVGDLAPGHGAQPTADPVIASGALGTPVEEKAAFNNPPYAYGVVERTFSEYKASLLPETLVSDYLNLPADLQGGALQSAYESSIVAGTGGNYEDGDPRYFSCQTCHMRPVVGVGCNKNGTLTRSDLPQHDLTGGNYWMPDAITYLDGQGKLLIGGPMTADEVAGINAGKERAKRNLEEAAGLEIVGNVLRVINRTGHKLISGYPEGRRMWLNIRWYDDQSNLVREDGEYGSLTVDIDGTPTPVDTILDLHPTNTKIYEAHYGITQEWAAKLLLVGYPPALPIGYDRVTGAILTTLGDIAAQDPLTTHETFHFVINDAVIKDNRIPPYGMRYDIARVRNALPVPDSQYGNPGPGGTYEYWDELVLDAPVGATNASIDLLYQPTSWEYIQFLYLANDGQNAFLANEGINMLDAWLNNGMAAPHIMASTTYAVTCIPSGLDGDGDGLEDTCDDPCPLDSDNDIDADGHCADADNCPVDPNPGQEDGDGDGVGNLCDPCPLDDPDDSDGDGICESADLCPDADDNLDTDGDGTPNCLESCPNDPSKTAPGVCGCSVSDADSDGDGVEDCIDVCLGDDATGDSDSDGVCDDDDLCPTAADPTNEDTNGDGIGNVCQCGDVDGSGMLDSADAAFIHRASLGLFVPPFVSLALCDVDNSGTCDSADAAFVHRGSLGLFVPPFVRDVCDPGGPY